MEYSPSVVSEEARVEGERYLSYIRHGVVKRVFKILHFTWGWGSVGGGGGDGLGDGHGDDL